MHVLQGKGLVQKHLFHEEETNVRMIDRGDILIYDLQKNFT